MEYGATMGRLSLGLLGLEGKALGWGALLARNRDNQLFLGLGVQRIWAKMARQTFDRLDFGDNGRDSLVNGACSQRWKGGKSLPNVMELTGGHSHTLMHGFWANILWGYACGIRSLSTRWDTLTSFNSDSCCACSSCCRAGPPALLLATLGGVSE